MHLNHHRIKANAAGLRVRLAYGVIIRCDQLLRRHTLAHTSVVQNAVARCFEDEKSRRRELVPQMRERNRVKEGTRETRTSESERV